MTDTSPNLSQPDKLTIPARLHHHAFLIEDHERTRHFYEDIIGLPLRAAWIEENVLNGDQLQFCHAFYGMADGGALAFFAFANKEHWEKYGAGPQKSLFYHVAFKADEDVQEAIFQRCEAAGIKSMRIDHGYCASLYVTDPDGLQVEFTVDPPNVDEIDAHQAKTAHDTLAAWSRGDRTTNNGTRLDHDVVYVR